MAVDRLLDAKQVQVAKLLGTLTFGKLEQKTALEERALMNTLVRIALRWAKCVLPFALRAAESPFRPGLHECSKYVVFSIDLAEAESPCFKFRNLNLLQGHQDSTHLEDSRG